MAVLQWVGTLGPTKQTHLIVVYRSEEEVVTRLLVWAGDYCIGYLERRH